MLKPCCKTLSTKSPCPSAASLYNSAVYKAINLNLYLMSSSLKKAPLVLALLLSVAFLSACNNSSDAMKQPEAPAAALPDIIKIGFIGPLTGNAASYGQDVKSGVEVYFKEHPTINGKTVQMIYEDGKCNGQDAVSAGQKLINVDKVQVIIGGQCSGETLAVAPIAEQAKVVMLSPLSSSPAITTAGDYIFRNYPSDEQVSKTMVTEVLKNQKKIALLSEQTDYAQGYRKAIQGHLKNANASDKLVVDEAFSVDSTDFRTLLTKAKEADADGLVAIGQTPVADGFMVRQAKELGLKVQVYGTDTIDGADFFKNAKDAAEGVKQIVVAEDPGRNGYSDFVQKIPTSQASPVFPAFGYDAANIVASAIASVGYDGTAIKDYFYKMPVFKGIACDVTFDQNGDNNVAAGVKVAKDGKFTLMSK